MCVRHKGAHASGSYWAPAVHARVVCARVRKPPEVVWNTLTTVYQCGCGRATAGLARQSAGAKQRHSHATQE